MTASTFDHMIFNTRKLYVPGREALEQPRRHVETTLQVRKIWFLTTVALVMTAKLARRFIEKKKTKFILNRVGQLLLAIKSSTTRRFFNNVGVIEKTVVRNKSIHSINGKHAKLLKKKIFRPLLREDGNHNKTGTSNKKDAQWKQCRLERVWKNFRMTQNWELPLSIVFYLEDHDWYRTVHIHIYVTCITKKVYQ